MDKNEPIRHKNVRLKNYDYSQAGYYFITICTDSRKKLLGDINQLEAKSENNSSILLTEVGDVVDKHISNINTIYNNVGIDCYVIMPNHIHVIIAINPKPSSTLPHIITSLKTITSKKIGFSIWQKNYYEHIIRCEQELQDIRNYIQNNPLKWYEDKYFSE